MPAGRPTKYQPSYPEIARKQCELGATDVELMDALGIGHEAFYRWKHEHPEFAAAIKTGKDHCDNRVERSLYHRAIGYAHDVVETREEDGKSVEVRVRQQLPPDPTSMIFWLSNRRRNEWRRNANGEEPRSEGGGNTTNININIGALSHEQLDALARILADAGVDKPAGAIEGSLSPPVPGKAD